MIKIVVDSTCCPDDDFVKENGIYVNPLRILFEDEEFTENYSLYDTIYKKMKDTQEIPKTSQPSLESFINIYNEIISNGDEAIVFTLSETLSGTYNCACLARENCSNPNRVTVFDTQSIGQTSIGYLYETVEMIKQGRTVKEIVDYLSKLRKNSAITFIPETLDNLKKNGRIGKITAVVGSLLKIKPVILFKEGVLSDKKSIGLAKAIVDMMKQVPEKVKHLFVIKAGMPDVYESFKQKVVDFFKGIKLKEGTVSPVVGAHVGPAIGLAWVAE